MIELGDVLLAYAFYYGNFRASETFSLAVNLAPSGFCFHTGPKKETLHSLYSRFQKLVEIDFFPSPRFRGRKKWQDGC